MGAPTIFISYSHKDEAWKDRLATHLKGAHILGHLDFWDDRRIAAGDAWKAEIQQAMAAASAAILLITPDFLASDFIHTDELPVLLARAAEGEKKLAVFPVLVRACIWQAAPWIDPSHLRPEGGRSIAAGSEQGSTPRE